MLLIEEGPVSLEGFIWVFAILSSALGGTPKEAVKKKSKD